MHTSSLRTWTAVRPAARRVRAVARRPADGFPLGVWWVAASGAGLLLLAFTSLAVSLVGSVRLLVAGALLLAFAGMANLIDNAGK